MPHPEIHDLDALDRHLASGQPLADCILQGLDLTGRVEALRAAHAEGAVFLGCRMTPEEALDLSAQGAVLFPALPALPYDPYRPHLYRVEELFAGFDPANPDSYCHTLDAVVYRHWQETGAAQPARLMEALARRLHDLSMSDGIEDLLAEQRKPVVAIMGGHSMRRDDPAYATVVEAATMLAEAGYLITTGGGPGAMEAGHLGVWLAGRSAEDRKRALALLAEAPHYKDRRWLAQAFAVRAALPPVHEVPSLGIPTWLYGHEPPNPFPSHTAKYFANSVREEGLVTVADHGIVFAPGSAGTVQEIFQDACQNHYASTGFNTPMVFLDRTFWTEHLPVVDLMRRLAKDKPWPSFIGLADTAAEVVDFLRAHPPVENRSEAWSFCG